MADPRTRLLSPWERVVVALQAAVTSLLAVAAVALLVSLVGCGTEATPPPAEPMGQVTGMRHDPDEVWYAGGVALRGVRYLTVCLLDTAGQPTGDCREVPVSEETWRETEIGDRMPVPDREG